MQHEKDRPHYTLGYAKYDVDKETGKRVKTVRPIRNKVDPSKQTYISTYVTNPNGSETIVTQTFDFDYRRADRKWRTEVKGIKKLDYFGMLLQLEKEHPEISKRILHVCESTSHTGFSIEIAISPITLYPFDPDKNEVIKKPMRLFQTTHKWLQVLFNSMGFGCDEGAYGSKRFSMNWKNPEYNVYTNRELHHRVWTRSHRSNILRQMFDYLKSLPIIAAGDKERWTSDDFKLTSLYPDKRCEVKLAHFLVDLVDNGYQVATSAKELIEGYSFSKRFVYEVIRKNGFPEKMGINVKSTYGDWEISIDQSSPALSLAFDIVGGRKEERTLDFKEGLCPPEDCVEKRYKWLGKAIVYLKVAGYSLQEAIRVMLEIVKRIPEYYKSRNCRTSELVAKCKSIYRRAVKEYKSHILPHFLSSTISSHRSESFCKKGSEEIHLNPKKVKGAGEQGGGSGYVDGSVRDMLSSPIQEKPESMPNLPTSSERGQVNQGLPSQSEAGVVGSVVDPACGKLCFPQLVHQLVHNPHPETPGSPLKVKSSTDRRGSGGTTDASKTTTQPSVAETANLSHAKEWASIILFGLEKRLPDSSLRLGLKTLIDFPFPDFVSKDSRSLVEKIKNLVSRVRPKLNSG